jgi:hypothetical protein
MEWVDYSHIMMIFFKLIPPFWALLKFIYINTVTVAVTPQKSINSSNIPNPSPVVHEGCRSGGHLPVSLITPSASTAIRNVQLAIKDTNLPNKYFTLKKLYKNSA